MIGSSDMTPAAVPDSLSADVLDGLERVDLPSYLVDRDGRIRWLNDAALSLLGEPEAGRDLQRRGAVGQEHEHLVLSRRQRRRRRGVGLSTGIVVADKRSRNPEHPDDLAAATKRNRADTDRPALAFPIDHVELEVRLAAATDHLPGELLA